MRSFVCIVLVFLIPVTSIASQETLPEILIALTQALEKVERGLTTSETALAQLETDLDLLEKEQKNSEQLLTDLQSTWTEYQKTVDKEILKWKIVAVASSGLTVTYGILRLVKWVRER